MLYILINLDYVLDEERWNPLNYPGIKENKYDISDYGRIINKETGRELAQVPDKDGYLTCKLMDVSTNKGKYFKIHRLVGYTFNITPENFNQLQINHLNGKNNDNYYKNLQWVTNEVNSAHKFALGLHIPKKGIDHGMNLHSEVIIHRICSLIRDKISTKEIMKELDSYLQEKQLDFKKMRDVVYKIKAKKIWTEISSKYF